MKSVAIITARGGSKRIPRKNIKSFLGKPIIAYSIEKAINSGLFEEVMVSTEDDEIAEIAAQYGAKIPFKRSKENADDYASTVDVVLEVLASYQEIGVEFDTGCCIYPTAPFITEKRLQEAKRLMEEHQFDTVFPVTAFSFPIQRALKKDEKNRISMFQPEHLMTRSQDLEKAYHDSGQFYWFNIQALQSKKRLWTDHSGVVVLSEMEVQDIDNPEDWEIAEFKYQLFSKKY